MTPTAVREVLTSPQVASLIGCRPQTLRKWRLIGKGPRYVRLGDNPRGRVAYLLSDITEWLTSHRFSSTSEETVKAGLSAPAARDRRGDLAGGRREGLILGAAI
jgi:predicted DNA-binding transcriptional regulator AlpA